MTEKHENIIEILRKGGTAEELARAVVLRAMMHLIGPVGGHPVLDLACGDGDLSRWFAIHGALVTGVDKSVETIELARKHEIQDPHGVSYIVGDAEDLYMIEDSAFDVVVCNLALARIENLSSVVAEVARIIRLGGRFIFSVAHPCFESRLFGGVPRENYFAEELHDSSCGQIRHRTLATYINAVAARGFTVRRVLEPAADKHDVAINPDFEPWCRMPVALVIEAVFPKI